MDFFIRWIKTLSLSACLAACSAYAYPNFIGFSYNSCLTCHYNPNGGGPLTDYGRATGAVAVSAKPFFDPDIDDDALAAQSQFFGNAVTLPSWLRPAFGHRSLFYRSRLQSDQFVIKWIQMQTEGSLTLKSPSDQWVATATVGYVPPPQASPGGAAGDYSSIISREHYLSYRPTESFGVALGKMDTAFGIHVPDHNAYFRGQTGLSQSDQTYTVQTHFAGEHWEMINQALLGNFTDPPEIRQMGVSTLFERDVLEHTRAGISGLVTRGQFRSRDMLALHGRFGLPEGSAILAEIGIDHERYGNSTSVNKQFAFLQTYAAMARGIFLMATLEYFKTKETTNIRISPGLQYFPFNRVELRADFQSTQVFGQTPIQPNRYDLLFQVHVWL